MALRRFEGREGSLLLRAAALLVLLVAVGWVSSRHYLRFDWTRSRLYSISQRTQQVLGELTKPLHVIVFLSSQGETRSPIWTEVHELVTRLAAESPMVEVELVDPMKNRTRAEELVKLPGVDQASTIILELGEGDDVRRHYVPERDLAEWNFDGIAFGEAPKLVAFRGEEVLTAGIEALIAGREKRVVFMAGHGEPSFKGERPNELGRAAEALRRENFEVEEWTSLAAREVPAGTDVLIEAGPRKPLLPNEIKAIEAYLEGGGRLLALIDPVFAEGGGRLEPLGIEKLLAGWGLELGNDVVVDPAAHLPFFDADTLYTNRVRPHPVTRGLAAFPLILPLARSIKITRAIGGYHSQILVETSHQGWAETNLAALPGAVRDPADLPGPVPVAAALGPDDPLLGDVLEHTVPGRRFPKAEKPIGGGKTRIVLFGDSEFASNQLFDRNAPYFLASVDWLGERESLLGIPPKKLGKVSLRLTQDQLFDVQLVIFVVLPGLVALLGLLVWWRRRN